VYFIDANIFLEVMLNQKQSQDCIEFLKKLEKGKFNGMINDFLLYSICLTIIRETSDLNLVSKFLKVMNSYENLMIYHPSIPDLLRALSFMDEFQLDFDDSLVLSCMKILEIKKLVSFDRHFDKIPSIQRLKPPSLR